MRARHLLALSAAAVLAGCSLARMPAPESLAAAPRLEVQGRQGSGWSERIAFGEYATDRVRRSTRSTGARQTERSRGESFRQTYAFTLSRGAEPVYAVECLAGSTAAALSTGRDSELHAVLDRSLDCTLAPNADPQRFWQLSLETAGDGSLAGALARGEERLRVAETREVEGAFPLCCEASGYRVGAPGGELAAVDVMNDGAVLLAPGLDAERRDLAAAVATVLLLHGNLGEEQVTAEG